MKLVDSHAHLDDRRLASDLPQVIERARTNGVEAIVSVGADLPSSRAAVAVASRYPGVWATVGVHPHGAAGFAANDDRQLADLARDGRVVAIGEIGLDYHYDFSPRPVQIEVFRLQMELAAVTGLPVVIHNREAHADTLTVLREYAGQVRGVLHCFSGSREMMEEVVRLGYYVSVAGPVTFANAGRLRQVVAAIPSGRLLWETDCPYLAPVPWRGRRNEPAYLTAVARQVAEIRGVPVEDLAEQVWDNFEELFITRGQN
ncbi:MAG: TatD family hydrolase [Negativicutes bacterium]|nr:TatD family hydrolase [Negativicutes bacterium]